MNDSQRALLSRTRAWLLLFVVGLLLSGVTAFPLLTEVRILDELIRGSEVEAIAPWLAAFLSEVLEALQLVDTRFPFLAYGTDWLAFAHIVIAIAFYGPWKDPVRNLWVIHFGMIACVLVVPFALIAGPVRGIPPLWRLIDCSFGVFGIIPLIMCRRNILALARLSS